MVDGALRSATSYADWSTCSQGTAAILNQGLMEPSGLGLGMICGLWLWPLGQGINKICRSAFWRESLFASTPRCRSCCCCWGGRGRIVVVVVVVVGEVRCCCCILLVARHSSESQASDRERGEDFFVVLLLYLDTTTCPRLQQLQLQNQHSVDWHEGQPPTWLAFGLYRWRRGQAALSVQDHNLSHRGKASIILKKAALDGLSGVPANGLPNCYVHSEVTAQWPYYCCKGLVKATLAHVDVRRSQEQAIALLFSCANAASSPRSPPHFLDLRLYRKLKATAAFIKSKPKILCSSSCSSAAKNKKKTFGTDVSTNEVFHDDKWVQLYTGVSGRGWALATFWPNIAAEWAVRFRDYSTADGCWLAVHLFDR